MANLLTGPGPSDTSTTILTNVNLLDNFWTKLCNSNHSVNRNGLKPQTKLN